MKKMVAIGLLVFVILVFTGCTKNSAYGNASISAGTGDTVQAVTIKKDAVVLKLAYDVADDHPKAFALFDMKKYVEEKSNGSMTFEMYPNNSLGAEAAVGDLIINGSIDMGIVGSVYAERIPRTTMCDTPFLFSDWNDVKKFLDSDFGRNFYANTPADHGIRQIGFNPQGFREIMSNKPVRKMDDFKGLRLRVPQVNLYIAMGTDLGTSPISMALTELYTAIEQNAVDALENTWSYLNSAKYYEVTKYLIETNHNFSLMSLFMNEKSFQRLSPDNQKIILGSGKVFQDQCFVYYQNYEKEARDNITSHGVEIITPDAKFRQDIVASMKTSYQLMFTQYPGSQEVVNQIRAILAK
jgi:tripartite ATP-independent transporter DctP family solute receptor